MHDTTSPNFPHSKPTIPPHFSNLQSDNPILDTRRSAIPLLLLLLRMLLLLLGMRLLIPRRPRSIRARLSTSQFTPSRQIRLILLLLPRSLLLIRVVLLLLLILELISTSSDAWSV